MGISPTVLVQWIQWPTWQRTNAFRSTNMISGMSIQIKHFAIFFNKRQNRHLVILLKVGSCDVGQSRNRYCIETLYTDAHGLAILHAWVHHGIPPTCTGNTCFRRPPGAHFPLNIVVEHWIFESHPKNRCNGAMHLQSSWKLPYQVVISMEPEKDPCVGWCMWWNYSPSIMAWR